MPEPRTTTTKAEEEEAAAVSSSSSSSFEGGAASLPPPFLKPQLLVTFFLPCIFRPYLLEWSAKRDPLLLLAFKEERKKDREKRVCG